MSNPAWLLLNATYIVPLALLAWMVAGREVSRTRATLIVLLALPFLYLSHHILARQAAGLPTDQPVPESFRLLGFEVDEPDRKTGSGGSILLWLHGADAPSPRVHRLPYARDLHESLLSAGERQAAGTTQVGVRRSAGPATASGGTQTDTNEIEFRDEKPVRPPAKDST